MTPITRIEVSLVRPSTAQRIPLNSPALETEQVVAVTLHTADGTQGLGFTTVGLGRAALFSLIEQDLGPLVVGEMPLPEKLFAKAAAACRSAGWHGLACRAWAAIDIALWDLKAKLAGVPLYRVLGGHRESAAVHLSARPGEETAAMVKWAKPLIAQGALGLTVDVGGGDVQLDADRVQQVRDGLGEDAWLGVAVEGRYNLSTALALAHFYEEDVGIDRYDAPLPGHDRIGYQRLAERMEVPLALGGHFDRRDDFRQTLERGDIRVLRPDVLRLGGLTPVVRIAALAEAYPVVVSPVRLPELGVHLACGLPNVDAVEFTTALSGTFTQELTWTGGRLTPPQAPGHGWALA